MPAITRGHWVAFNAAIMSVLITIIAQIVHTGHHYFVISKYFSDMLELDSDKQNGN